MKCTCIKALALEISFGLHIDIEVGEEIEVRRFHEYFRVRRCKTNLYPISSVLLSPQAMLEHFTFVAPNASQAGSF